MKGAVYEKQFSFSHDHEIQIEKESTVLARAEVLAETSPITVGRGGKCNYPVAVDKSIILHHVDVSKLYIQGDGTATVVYIIGTEE